MSQLPSRGTGLVIGRARTERGRGTPLTYAERLERHEATQIAASASDTLLISALFAAAAGLFLCALATR